MTSSVPDILLRRLARLRIATNQVVYKKALADLLEDARTSPGIPAFDFTLGRSEEQLEVLLHSMIAGIASMRDHLKNWCNANAVKFEGDDLISNNKYVAVVHDLWNIDKHGVLNRPPRSGFIPRIGPLHMGLLVQGPRSIPETSETFIDFTKLWGADYENRAVAVMTVGGNVMDENNTFRVGVMRACVEATYAWEMELRRVGAIDA